MARHCERVNCSREGKEDMRAFCIYSVQLFCFIYALQEAIKDTNNVEYYLHYNDHSLRQKKSIPDDYQDYSGPDWEIPGDVSVQNDTEDHIYYKTLSMTNDKDAYNRNIIDIEEMLKKPGVVGNISHEHLKNQYRRAVPVDLTFQFPFYGHKLKNLTIATGGFIYVGDQTHYWLTATQYIAPLMANFNTINKEAEILYADDGTKFACEWRNLQLRGQENDGLFTFQTILHSDGNITFVYKNIPIPINNISEEYHPVKIGVSDAYLFNRKFVFGQPQAKRVIYEYHRIPINTTLIGNGSVVCLFAQPTCQNLITCNECTSTKIPNFNCSWCHATKAHGGPFCTDSGGLHRRRQHWIEMNCRAQSRAGYCSEDSEIEVADDSSEFNTTTIPAASESTTASTSGGRGSGFLIVLAVIIIAAIGWVAYAYYNPHTPSGQLLIKYRPSRLHEPLSHVRYQASVHM